MAMGSGQGFVGLLLLVIPMLILSSSSQATAHKFYVGGNEGWVLKPKVSYNYWAERTRFRVNDTLYFKYHVGYDSVLVVKKEAYDACNTTNPLHNMDDGDSEFRLDNSGPFFFISGKVDNCKQGQKLVVVVLSNIHHKPWTPSPTAPAKPPTWTPSLPATPPAWAPSPPATPPAWVPSVAPSSPKSDGPSGVLSPAPAPSPSKNSGSLRFGGSVGVAMGLGVGVVLFLCSFV